MLTVVTYKEKRMLHNVRYDTIKLTHKLSCLIWFIEKHAIEDAQTAGDDACVQAMRELKSDLQKHLETFDAMSCCKNSGEACSGCRS